MKRDLSALAAAVFAVIQDAAVPERREDLNAPCCTRCRERMSLDASGDMYLCGNIMCGLENLFK